MDLKVVGTVYGGLGHMKSVKSIYILDQHTTTNRGLLTPDDNPLGCVVFHGLAGIHYCLLVDDDPRRVDFGHADL